MKKSKKTKVQQLFGKLSRKKWIIECRPEFMENFFEILKEEKIPWFNDAPVRPKKNATQFLFDCDTHRFKFKHNKLRFDPQEYYLPYHYRTLSFEEFYDLYCEANTKDKLNQASKKLIA